ncbi:3-methyladenine DNA glycosylase [Balneolaceae bacterium YR4-1]|uniref:3-methyladenine DNA glycosylase n=1 Tax=Halalkalibaculum roseum TaxID=2709311 RepID=A0A6M1SPN3_9BACT|nr:3-methyladenine DNA glycosylase [Halalkalibaculum roseum]NGP77059.1 3-methyladenine DNA glycosylase [Halalkalibaculum roseum]
MISTDTKTEPVHSEIKRSDWRQRIRAHKEAVSNRIDDYLELRQQHRKDPVLDFLFEYYAFRPSHLRRWSPGFGVLLRGNEKDSYPELSELSMGMKGAYLNPEYFPENRKRSIRWILELLENSGRRKPSFGCFGMHEWAMVYKKDKDQIRHRDIPLRMDKEKLASFVESRPLVCTHFDAFRFFAKPAKPLNKFELSRDSFSNTEQAGCIHTNMDLYKWAFKGFPWISSEVILEAFDLAVEARTVDMKASPYDLEAYGLEPIRIETESGRMAYLEAQKAIYERSKPIRDHLIKEYRTLVHYFDE